MAVQKNRKTRAKRDKRRSHDALRMQGALSVDSVTGETHLRHHLTVEGYYRGRQVVQVDNYQSQEEE